MAPGGCLIRWTEKTAARHAVEEKDRLSLRIAVFGISQAMAIPQGDRFSCHFDQVPENFERAGFLDGGPARTRR